MSGYLRKPPKIKVLEAAGAVADGRIRVIDDYRAYVTSSDGSRRYLVYVDMDRGEACSTDNGTVYRGYIGYPIISLLMLKGRLPYDERIGKALRGIPWKKLNEELRKYSLVEDRVKSLASLRGVKPSELISYRDRVYELIKKLRLRLVSSKCVEAGAASS